MRRREAKAGDRRMRADREAAHRRKEDHLALHVADVHPADKPVRWDATFHDATPAQHGFAATRDEAAAAGIAALRLARADEVAQRMSAPEFAAAAGESSPIAVPARKEPNDG